MAVVGSNSLYWEDIVIFIPENLSAEDSIMFINDFVERWAAEQLLFIKAEEQLRNTADIERMVDDYRKQLYIHKFKTEIIYSSIENSVSFEEIHEYYKNHLADFTLNQAYVKAHYLTMSALATSYYRERNIVLSTEQGDHQKLLDYATGTGRRVYFHDDWIKLSDFLKKINFQNEFDPERLRNERLIENTDFNLRYIVKINEYKLKGDPAPIDLVESAIIDIILNNRRQSAYNQFVNSLLIDAKDRGEFVNNYKPIKTESDIYIEDEFENTEIINELPEHDSIDYYIQDSSENDIETDTLQIIEND